MNASGTPILLLLSRDGPYPFDAYLEEILLTEGYTCFEKRFVDADEAADLGDSPLALISSGAAACLDPGAVLEYVRRGGRAIILKPPRAWASLFGLAPATELYATARDAYLQVNAAHPWLAGFPAVDLQVPGEALVHALQSAEPLAFVAGQRGRPSLFPAVSLFREGEGAAVLFTYDLAETIVLLHQGRPEHSSTGSDPDANRDGKFTGDDCFEGMRDYELRHVPQADVHQDLLVRVLRGLLAEVCPVPRLWHFPNAAPALLFIDGDGDSMVWEDLEWVVAAMAETGARYTLYLMDAQIEAFDPEKIGLLRRQGHEFGVHPWVGAQPDVETWRAGIAGIVERFHERFGYAPRALRAHCCIFPGWDENPRLLAGLGLRLETSFGNGYRFVSGYLNGSGLPVKFISRDGEVLDCYEHNTVQTEDGSCTPKGLLPPLSEEEALETALLLLRECVERWHGVFHPYFHPISLAGRTPVKCQRWFREVLRAARAHGLPSVNAGEWLDFNDARRAVAVEAVQWDGDALSFALGSPVAVEGLTVLLPPWGEGRPAQQELRSPWVAMVDGKRQEILDLPYEGLQWQGLVVDLPAGARVRVRVTPELPDA